METVVIMQKNVFVLLFLISFYKKILVALIRVDKKSQSQVCSLMMCQHERGCQIKSRLQTIFTVSKLLISILVSMRTFSKLQKLNRDLFGQSEEYKFHETAAF